MSGIENIQNTQFMGSTPKKTVEIKAEDKKEKPKFDNKKIIGALVGLGAVAAAGVAIASKIKKGKTVDTDFIETSIRPNNFDNMDIDEFRKIGCFKKGETFIADNPYTGIINVKNKNGIFALKYENGKLIESTKYKEVKANIPNFLKDNPLFENPKLLISKKVYSTSEDGAKTIQKFSTNRIGKEYLASTTKITPDEVKRTVNVNGIELSRGAYKKEIKSEDGTIKHVWQPYEEKLKVIPLKNNDTRASKNLKKQYGKVITIDPRVKKGEPRLEIAEPRYARYATGKSKPLIRKTENGVTYKNGSKFAEKTQTIDEKGNKIITIDYGTPTKKTITITPEGKRMVDYIN